MKAVVFEDVGMIALREVPEPRLRDPGDAIVRLTASALGGTDLHLVRGTLPGMQPGTILGHEGVGVVEEVGRDVRRLRPGDRVVVSATISCGSCAPCRAGQTSQCDRANPLGSQAGTCFFGGPPHNGAVHGLQAERARVPFAASTLVPLPDDVLDEHAVLLSDVLPTGLWAAERACITRGTVVAIFGCGAVGQAAIVAAHRRGAGRVLAIDGVQGRLETARRLGAETILYDVDDPVEAIHELTGGAGADVVIDAVGIDAHHPEHGPAARRGQHLLAEFAAEVAEVAEVAELAQLAHHANPKEQPASTASTFLWPRSGGGAFHVGTAPSQALQWAVDCVAKSGTVVVLGSYPTGMHLLSLGDAQLKNASLRMGTCPHRALIPRALEALRDGTIDAGPLLSHVQPFDQVVDAYRSCDERQPGWTKVELSAAGIH